MIFERGHFKSTRIQNGTLNEAIQETRTFSTKDRIESKPTVFISHKHSDLEDLEELKGVMEILQDLGAKIYIDSMDNRMPGYTCGETARRIKDVIKYCKKFVLIATEKAIESYWCNWELGIGDVHKYIKHIAILPIKEKGQLDYRYKGNEYLQIYPRIDFEYGTSYYMNSQLIERGYYIVEPIGNDGIKYLTSIEEWLNN